MLIALIDFIFSGTSQSVDVDSFLERSATHVQSQIKVSRRNSTTPANYISQKVITMPVSKANLSRIPTLYIPERIIYTPIKKRAQICPTVYSIYPTYDKTPVPSAVYTCESTLVRAPSPKTHIKLSFLSEWSVQRSKHPQRTSPNPAHDFAP